MVVIKKILKLSFLLYLSSCSIQNIGSYEGSEKQFIKCESLFNDGKYLRAKESFKSWMYNAGLSSNLSKAQFYIAECEYNLNEYNQALIEYDKYLGMADQSLTLSKKSELMICRCYYNLTNDYKKDQTETKRALENLQYYIEKKSMEDHVEEIEDMIADLRIRLAKKDFETAKFYIRIEEYESARLYFENILKEFYDTEFFGVSIYNLSLMKYYDNKENAINFFKNYEKNFYDKNEYDFLISELEKLDLDNDFDYCLKQLK